MLRIKSLFNNVFSEFSVHTIIKKGKTTVIEGTGLTLLNQSSDAAGDLILASTWSEEPLDDKVPAVNITLNTDTRIEFTMTEYLTEGKYSLRIETIIMGKGIRHAWSRW